MKYFDRITWVENIEKRIKAKDRRRFDVDVTLFLRKKWGCYKRLILLRRTKLTEKKAQKC